LLIVDTDCAETVTASVGLQQLEIAAEQI